jgi:UDP-N-acetylmuramate-alanine ligase
VPGATLETLAEAVRGTFRAPLHVVKALDEVPAHVADLARPDDLVVLLGAGSIGSIWRKVLDELDKVKGQRSKVKQ